MAPAPQKEQPDSEVAPAVSVCPKVGIMILAEPLPTPSAVLRTVF